MVVLSTHTERTTIAVGAHAPAAEAPSNGHGRRHRREISKTASPTQ
jgi:hypothetical protein